MSKWNKSKGGPVIYVYICYVAVLSLIMHVAQMGGLGINCRKLVRKTEGNSREWLRSIFGGRG
jgi:hypothetical protein